MVSFKSSSYFVCVYILYILPKCYKYGNVKETRELVRLLGRSHRRCNVQYLFKI